MDRCERVLKALIQHEAAGPFLEPIKLKEVPDYLDFVATPMDLSTVKDKLFRLEVGRGLEFSVSSLAPTSHLLPPFSTIARTRLNRM